MNHAVSQRSERFALAQVLLICTWPGYGVLISPTLQDGGLSWVAVPADIRHASRMAVPTVPQCTNRGCTRGAPIGGHTLAVRDVSPAGNRARNWQQQHQQFKTILVATRTMISKEPGKAAKPLNTTGQGPPQQRQMHPRHACTQPVVAVGRHQIGQGRHGTYPEPFWSPL